MTAEIADVNNSHLRAEDRCGSLHIGGHRGAGGRKVDGEQNLLNHLIMVAAARWLLHLSQIVVAANPARWDRCRWTVFTDLRLSRPEIVSARLSGFAENSLHWAR